MPSDQSDMDLAEWTQARTVISGFDDRLDATRKFGLTLVSTLLTTDALLLPSSIGGASSLPPLAKFAVLLATLLLVTAVELIDRNYRVIQRAASQRALVLERMMNLELTEVISDRYAQSGVNETVYGVYLLMGGGSSSPRPCRIGPEFLVLDTRACVRGVGCRNKLHSGRLRRPWSGRLVPERSTHGQGHTNRDYYDKSALRRKAGTDSMGVSDRARSELQVPQRSDSLAIRGRGNPSRR